MSENLSPCLRSHHEIITEFIYVYTVQDCLMCIADCYFCASRLTFSSLLLMLRLCIWRTAFLWCCWLNKLNKFINSWWSRMSENSIYCCLIYGCLIYFVYMYVLWKWDSKMCILMVILRVITINYSHRTLIINFSLHFLIFFMVNYWGRWLYRPSPPHLKYWGGGYIPLIPPPPGIDTHDLYTFNLIFVFFFFISRREIVITVNPILQLGRQHAAFRSSSFRSWCLGCPTSSSSS